MKVTINTLDEARASRVELTFESQPTHEHVIGFSRRNAEVRLEPAERLYTAREVGDLQASEAELVATPLQRQVKELQAALAQRADVISDLRIHVDQNREWAERAEEQAEKAEKLAAEMKERAERAEMFKSQMYQENERGTDNRQRIKLARQALCTYFPGSLVNDDIASHITEMIRTIKELRGEVGGYQGSSERCERELHNARVNIESRDRRLLTATTALRKICQEVDLHSIYEDTGEEPKLGDVIDNIRDLSAPWADTSQA